VPFALVGGPNPLSPQGVKPPPRQLLPGADIQNVERRSPYVLTDFPSSSDSGKARGWIAAAVAGLGAMGVSQTERSQGVATYNEETTNYNGAAAEAGRLFNALTRNQGP
jgi:hypothetical protein